MAIKWSWAWGPETALVLETSGGWDFSSTSASNVAPSSSGGADPEFTYPGSPTRYTMNFKNNTLARSPFSVGAPQGWIAGNFFLNNASGFQDYRFFSIVAESNNRAIYAQSASPNTIKLYVDNSFKEQTTATFPAQTWHHIAISYDMTTTTWSAQLFVNGTAVTANQTDSGVAQTSTHFDIRGCRNTTLVDGTFWAGLVHYDDVTDPGSTSRFVTRISPDQDVGLQGTWTPDPPSGNNYPNLSSPLNAATTVDNTAPAPTDQVTTGVSNLATQLGISPNIYAITTHGYSVGTGSSVEAGLGASPGGPLVVYGAPVVTGAATYCTVTSETNPVTTVDWVAADQPYLRFEIA